MASTCVRYQLCRTAGSSTHFSRAADDPPEAIRTAGQPPRRRHGAAGDGGATVHRELKLPLVVDAAQGLGHVIVRCADVTRASSRSDRRAPWSWGWRFVLS